ncbi:cytochrome C [Luteibacter sahnii]|uniref:cytochrome C n=1 Tax=Luteibacter sahnii TaxID=3021977 RepID=UPI002A6B4DCB|nr:cytochrome C [Luteibacter sp. PPL193]MDY1548479.1 cytochrome C [Luteibacter sp. PPL193]
MRVFSFGRCGRRPGLAGWGVTLALLLSLASQGARAIPVFARQTGASCADCHAGSYGPALTPYGMRFKLGGYTDTDGKGRTIPVSLQLTETHLVPAKGNNSTALTEGDLFLAGRLTDNVGGVVKVVAARTGPGKYNTQLGDVDLRYVAKELTIGGKSALLGVTVNNNPGFQDPIGALPAFSDLLQGGRTGTLLNPAAPNALANHVIGASLYGVYDTVWYAEAGTYRSLSLAGQDAIGFRPGSDPGHLSDTGYVRFAYMKDMRRQFVSAGVVALTSQRRLPRAAPADRLDDYGYDLTYQYLGNREHILQASYVNIYEHRRYGSRPANPLVPGSLASARGYARDEILSATYTFMQTYGVTVSHLRGTGSDDPARYSPVLPDPDATTNYLTLFWAPFGKDDAWISKGNLKLAATWFRTLRFNGRSSNIFGAPPGVRGANAADINGFVITANLAF